MHERHHIGSLDALSETEGKRARVGKVALAIFRRGDRVIAVEDACPHMGACLSEGYLDGESVVCPWHGWSFDVNTGNSPFDDEARVTVYPVVVESGEVYVLLAGASAGATQETTEEGRRRA